MPKNHEFTCWAQETARGGRLAREKESSSLFQTSSCVTAEETRCAHITVVRKQQTAGFFKTRPTVRTVVPYVTKTVCLKNWSLLVHTLVRPGVLCIRSMTAKPRGLKSHFCVYKFEEGDVLLLHGIIYGLPAVRQRMLAAAGRIPRLPPSTTIVLSYSRRSATSTTVHSSDVPTVVRPGKHSNFTCSACQIQQYSRTAVL